MDFLGIGSTEILLIVLIAFVVLGPDRIPGVMRQLGKWLRQAREMTNNITRDYSSDIKSLTGEITALQNEIRGIQRELGQFSSDLLTGFSVEDAAPPQTDALLPPLPQQADPSKPGVVSPQGAPDAPATMPPVENAAPDDRDSYRI